MSELVSTRIRTTAGKLGLPQLTETVNEFIRRADEGMTGCLDFLDLAVRGTRRPTHRRGSAGVGHSAEAAMAWPKPPSCREGGIQAETIPAWAVAAWKVELPA